MGATLKGKLCRCVIVVIVVTFIVAILCGSSEQSIHYEFKLETRQRYSPQIDELTSCDAKGGHIVFGEPLLKVGNECSRMSNAW